MIKFIQKQSLIDGKNIAWVDIIFVDYDNREYPLRVAPIAKKRLYAYFRVKDFKIGVLPDGEILHEKIVII